MEKTIEEIRKAVLAYCDEVCPQGTRHDVVANDVTIGWMDHGATMDGGLRMYFFADWMYIDADMDDRTALLAYRLFGLDKRDALEAEKEKSKRWESRAWKILQIVRRRETEQRPKTAAVLRTLREVSEKNEELLEGMDKLVNCIGNTKFMYKLYLESKDANNSLNLSKSIGELGRAKTKFEKQFLGVEDEDE